MGLPTCSTQLPTKHSSVDHTQFPTGLHIYMGRLPATATFFHFPFDKWLQYEDLQTLCLREKKSPQTQMPHTYLNAEETRRTRGES